MNWIQNLFRNKKVDEPKNSALNKHNVIGSVCPSCGRKGYKTTLFIGRSYACKNKKCGIWWVNGGEGQTDL